MKDNKKRIAVLSIVLMIVVGTLSFVPQSISAAEKSEWEIVSVREDDTSYSFTYEKIFFQLKLGLPSVTEEQEDFWRVITSCEELQEFVDGDLSAYCEKMRFINEKQYERLQQHLQTLDEEFFSENVYVVTVNGNFTFTADLYYEGLVSVGKSEENQLYGKTLKLSYGYGVGDMVVPGVVYGGTVIPKADLAGNEIVNVDVSDSVPEEPIEKWEGNYKYESSKYDYFGTNCVKIVDYTTSDETTVIEIPSELGGKPVVIIGEGAFEGIDAEKIVLPDTIREIQVNAFANSQVKEIVLPKKLEVIGDSAFYGITGMDTITVPRQMDSIGINAFGSDEGNVMTICGYEDSLAESYAKEQGNPFVSIGKVIKSTCLNWHLHYGGDVLTRYGDTDKDGLYAEDALKILQYVVGLTDGVDERSADANQDGTIDAEDALYVLECVVELKEAHVLKPQAYEIYQSYLGNLKRSPFVDFPTDEILDDFWRIIESKEELQEFIQEDLEKYYEKLVYGKVGDNHIALRHMSYLDVEFFEENVYVVSIIGYSPCLTTYTIDCIEDVNVDADNALDGKRLKMIFGSLDEDVFYADEAMEAVLGGVVIPRSDLDGKELVDVQINTCWGKEF